MLLEHYHIDGVDYPRVTAVLDVIDKGYGLLKWVANLGWDASQKAKREAAAKGSRNHADIAELLKLPNEAYASFLGHPEHYTSVVAKPLAEFLNRFQGRPVFVEKTVHSRHGYAGTIDAVLAVKYNKKDELWLVDWKFTKAFRKEAMLQTAAYEEALFDTEGLRVDRRVCVRFNNDKWYKKFHENPDDLTGFLGALEVYKWLKRSKLKS